MDTLLETSPLSAGTLYRLLSGSICPRPIAWVATQAMGLGQILPDSRR